MKTSQLQKCPVCLFQYQNKNLDKHMHSPSHHKAIEKLKGSPQIHKCLACGVSLWGMTQYGRHIKTPGHITNLIYLQQNRLRGNGFTVDYTDDELAAVCAERDKKRVALKLKKRKEQKKRRKARKVAWFYKKFNCNWQTEEKILVNNNQITQSNSQSSNQPPPLNNEDTHESKQTVDCTDNFYSNQQSYMCCPSLYIMFTSAEEDEDCIQQSRSAMKEQFLDANPTDSSPVKIPLLSDVPPVNFKTDISSRHSSRCMTANTASEEHGQSFHASVVDHSHVNPCLSTTTNSMSRSVKKKQTLFVSTLASSDFSAADGELKKLADEPKLEHVENERLKKIKLAKKKTPTSTLQKPSPGYQTCGGGSSKQWHTTKQLEARIKGKSSPPTKPSGGYRLSAPNAGFLQESKVEQHRNRESTQSTHRLPALLNQSVTKREASKPNLSVARGMHASQKPNMTGSASKVLKPALHKLINSKRSQSKVNWKEIYEEATKKKLQNQKGLPRFGIEFVSPLIPGPQELILDEVEAFDEGFQWESINSHDGTPSSSIVPLSKNTCESQPPEASPGPNYERHGGDTSVTELTLLPVKTPLMKSKQMKSGDVSDAVRNVASLVNRTSGLVTEANALAELHGSEQHSRPVLNLLRHTKKQEDPNSNNKNVEIPKKMVRELLAIFHREEELRSCLDHVNSQLLLAQSALHASLSNFQNLQEIKQQVTAEMGMLISKNIEVLQGIQNSSLCGNVPNLGTESHQRVPDTPRLQQDQMLF